MALSKQKFREIVLQLLYSSDIGNPDPTLMVDLIMGELSVSKKNVHLAQERVKLIQQHLSNIDPLISSLSTSYEFERIHTVTRNILRLAVFELLYDHEIPPKVAIAEAIRLSRKFNTPESAAFVNALLDHLYIQSSGEKEDLPDLSKTFQTMVESEKIASEVIEKQKLKSEEDEI